MRCCVSNLHFNDRIILVERFELLPKSVDEQIHRLLQSRRTATHLAPAHLQLALCIVSLADLRAVAIENVEQLRHILLRRRSDTDIGESVGENEMHRACANVGIGIPNERRHILALLITQTTLLEEASQ